MNEPRCDRPYLELALPVRHRAQRSDDEERAAARRVAANVLEDRHRLDGLAEAHLVCEDGVLLVVPAEGQPAHE